MSDSYEFATHRLARPHQNIHWVINKNERQPMLELARLGINCEPAENDQFAGTERVKTWLHNKQLWFVESRVPRTVKQMMALRYAGARRDGQTREKMEVYKKNDELPDVVRYVAMAFPQFSEAPKTVMQRNISNFDDATQEQIQRMRRITAQERSSDEEVAESFW